MLMRVCVCVCVRSLDLLPARLFPPPLAGALFGAACLLELRLGRPEPRLVDSRAARIVSRKCKLLELELRLAPASANWTNTRSTFTFARALAQIEPPEGAPLSSVGLTKRQL